MPDARAGSTVRVLNLFGVPGYAMANSLKYAQNPRKYLVAKATLLDVVSPTDFMTVAYTNVWRIFVV